MYTAIDFYKKYANVITIAFFDIWSMYDSSGLPSSPLQSFINHPKMKKGSFILTIVSLLFLLTGTPQNTEAQDSIIISVEFAQAIITRAHEMAQYIPDTICKTFITNQLSKMIVVKSGNTQWVQAMGKEISPVLFLYPANKLLTEANKPRVSDSVKNNTREVGYIFDINTFNLSGLISIYINENTDENTIEDTDALASGLIHELVHVIQCKNRIFEKHTTTYSLFEDEYVAWQCELYIYSKIHPEILDITCDYENMKIKFPSAQEKSITVRLNNSIVTSLILFHCCGEKFLKTLYSDDTKK